MECALCAWSLLLQLRSNDNQYDANNLPTFYAQVSFGESPIKRKEETTRRRKYIYFFYFVSKRQKNTVYRQVKFPGELEDIYEVLFAPMRVSRMLFKRLVSLEYAQVRESNKSKFNCDTTNIASYWIRNWIRYRSRFWTCTQERRTPCKTWLEQIAWPYWWLESTYTFSSTFLW